MGETVQAGRQAAPNGGGPIGKPTEQSYAAPQAPAITLPKGGGAIRGIGEKFAANPVNGTGSISVRLATSPGRAGFGPQLALAYDSGAGNGPFGYGWSLSLPSITRKTDKGLPRYRDAEDSDGFVLSGAEDLVPVFKRGAGGDWVRGAGGSPLIDDVDRDGYTVRRYQPRIEGLFARVESASRTSPTTIFSPCLGCRRSGMSSRPTSRNSGNGCSSRSGRCTAGMICRGCWASACWSRWRCRGKATGWPSPPACWTRSTYAAARSCCRPIRPQSWRAAGPTGAGTSIWMATAPGGYRRAWSSTRPTATAC